MGTMSNISWTGPTYNPWHGCQKVSPGCDLCYMYREKTRYGQNPSLIVRSKPGTFDAPLRWQREAERGDRVGHDRLVFTCSWSDFFVQEADTWRADAWAIIKATPLLTYQILSKRVQRVVSHLPDDWGSGYPHVWLGASVENQRYANLRVPTVLHWQAAQRFISYEPALGPVDWTRILHRKQGRTLETINALAGHSLKDTGDYRYSNRISWLIMGGESGPLAQVRRANIDWLSATRQQCTEAGVPLWFKQFGAGHGFTHPAGANPAEWPEDWRVQQMPRLGTSFVGANGGAQF